MMLCVLLAMAQKDVTTFLGIPVDGFKSDMRKSLIAKGFTPKQVSGQEYFEGEFNNKVYRIMLCDANTQSEANIKIRFNKLVSQFENNKRYTTLGSYTISDDEDISYEMLVHNKNYDALFYQNLDLEKIDTLALQKQVREELLKKYSEEELQNPTEETEKEAQSVALKIVMDMLFKKPVGFRISELYGEYYITMFYDNEYNHANGEDL